jgi:hypothetical protein
MIMVKHYAARSPNCIQKTAALFVAADDKISSSLERKNQLYKQTYGVDVGLDGKGCGE